jgi:hypothetical protein
MHRLEPPIHHMMVVEMEECRNKPVVSKNSQLVNNNKMEQRKKITCPVAQVTLSISWGLFSSLVIVRATSSLFNNISKISKKRKEIYIPEARDASASRAPPVHLGAGAVEEVGNMFDDTRNTCKSAN